MPVKRSAAASSKKRKQSSPRKKKHNLDQDLQGFFKSQQESLRDAVEKSAKSLRKVALDAKKAIDKQSSRAARNASKLKSKAASDPIAASALLMRQATDYLNEAMESVIKEVNSRLGGQPSKKPRKRAPARKK